jgi:hypothetical protein
MAMPPESARFLEILSECLESIREPRLFSSERGYQGELLAELKKRLRTAAFPGDPIVEQEYQKRLRSHGITIRPDLIVHVPFDRGTTRNRAEGNFVAIELKRRSTEEEALADFRSLEIIKEKLAYPLTVFVNIDAASTFAEVCPESIAKQTVCFSVQLKDGNPVVVRQHRTDGA